jgi:hypothetical protein
VSDDLHVCHWHADERGWVCCTSGCPARVKKREVPPVNISGAACSRPRGTLGELVR